MNGSRKSATGTGAGPLVFYVSGHGLGHASRACQVISQLPSDIPVIVKSRAPDAFFRRESRRGAGLGYIDEAWDSGAAQIDNRIIDWHATLAAATAAQDAADGRMASEAAWLREIGAVAVATDVAAPPLRAAAMAGVPGVWIGNFSWVEIFEAGFAAAGIDGRALLDRYRADQALATVAVRTPPAFPLVDFPHVRTVEPVGRAGTPRRGELMAALGLRQGTDRLALLYLGAWGGGAGGGAASAGIAAAAAGGWTFLSLSDCAPPVRRLCPDLWHFPDVVASVDVVVAKPGYGTAGECMANGVPTLYHPRPEFAEYPVLEAAMRRWGGAVRIPPADFDSGAWLPWLERAAALRPGRVPSGGARQAAGIIAGLARTV